MANVYALGAVKPWVKDAANEVGNKFGVTTIYGVGQRDGVSDHPKGLALDFMVGTDRSKGDQIAAYEQQNADALNITYIIWKQHIWNISRASEGWRAMPDRGSITANHYDHVHTSFKATARIGGSNYVGTDPGKSGIGISIPDPLSGIKSSIGNIEKVVTFVSDSHNWLRVAMFGAGFMLIILAVIMLGSGSTVTQAAAKTAKTVKSATKTKPVTKFKAAKISRPGGASYDPKG